MNAKRAKQLRRRIMQAVLQEAGSSDPAVLRATVYQKHNLTGQVVAAPGTFRREYQRTKRAATGRAVFTPSRRYGRKAGA